jgi:20S proteasome alpha/beta subunit
VTLILAIPATDGIVVASDGQVTAGEVRWTAEKIRLLGQRMLWSAAGELALIQRVEEAIATLPRETPLQELRDSLARAVAQSVNGLLQLDFRTGFFQANPDALLNLHPGDFIFVEYSSPPRILHISANGTPEWFDKPFASGVGAPFAYALLQRYQGVPMDTSRASLLAVKVLEEAIEVGSYGLGPPLYVWQVTEKGANKLGEAEIAALQDASKTLRSAEVELLIKGGE